MRDYSRIVKTWSTFQTGGPLLKVTFSYHLHRTRHTVIVGHPSHRVCCSIGSNWSTYTVISVELISPGNADAIRSDRRMRMRIAPAAAPAGDKRKVNASDHRVTPNAIIGTLYIMPNRLTEYLETRSSVVTLVGCAFHKHRPRAREGCPRSSFYRSVQEGCARLEAAQQGRLGRWWRRGRGLARRLHRLQRTPLFFVLV